MAGGLVALAIAVFAVLQLTGGDDSGGTTGGIAVSTTDSDASSGTPIDRSTVTVAVLNGTEVAGLAATIGDRIVNLGYQQGTITNSFDQERAESVILFAPGAEREAIAVSKQLDIPQREPIDPDSRALAGDATVVVVAGADQNQ